jgi:lipopolysaccharide heptosyltransferase I
MRRSAATLLARDRVLIVRLGAVGDVIRTLPAVGLLRSTFPGAHLAWIVEDLSFDLLEGHPALDEVIRLPRRALRRALTRPWGLPGLLAGLTRELRRRRFDVALEFQGSLKSGLIARLSGAPRRVGFAPGHSRELSWLLTNEHVRPPGRFLNRVARNLLLAEAVGGRGDRITIELPERREDGARARAILGELCTGGAPPVVLCPGTSRRQAGKRWPAAGFGRLAALLRSDPGVVPLVAWGPGEEEMARAVVAAAGGAALAMPATGLRVLAAVLRRAALFVGADTGPMHLAWSVGCPVLALFGPTDPRLNAPLGPGHAILRRGDSMSALHAEEVAAAARDLLRRAPGPRNAVATAVSRSALVPPAAVPP